MHIRRSSATWAFIALSLSAVAGGGPAEGATMKNGYWVNTPWVNGYWVNGDWVNATEAAGYLPGSASLGGGVVDGVSLAGMSKEGRSVRARLQGSELEGWVDESTCPTAGSADEPCRLKADGTYEQYHRGAWFENATFEMSLVPFVDQVELVCPMRSHHQISPDKGRAPRAVTLRIDTLVWDKARRVASYVLTVHDPGGKHRQLPCGVDPVTGFPVPAIPLEGAWNPFVHPVTGGGRIADGPDRVTFACANAVLGECVNGGYRPWEPPTTSRTAISGRLEAFDPRALHQACTRMLRADYCGDGRGFTVAGTWLDVADRFGIQTPSPELIVTWTPAVTAPSAPPPDMTGEAYWDAEGALAVMGPRYEVLDPSRFAAPGLPCRALGRALNYSLPDGSLGSVDASWGLGDGSGGRLVALLQNAHEHACLLPVYEARLVGQPFGPPVISSPKDFAEPVVVP